ncbi:MAG: glycosyltransferase, partial [Planctomycetota bacterium]|nr:glycosyltransferase [Planctomycetota bacterium]
TVLCVSRCVLAERLAWTGADPKPFRVFYNFVDRERFKPRPEARAAIRSELGLAGDAVLIGTVGRLSPIKNQALFLRAAALVAKEVPQARFVIVGDGRLRSELERLAAELGLASRTFFTGSRQDVERFYAAFDLFALTSSSEGFGLAAVEAQAAGAPVVCTAAGATAEVIADGISGLLVASHQPEAVAAAMLRVVQDRALAERLRAGGLEAARAFDRALAIRQLEEIYLSLCGGSPLAKEPAAETGPRQRGEN